MAPEQLALRDDHGEEMRSKRHPQPRHVSATVAVYCGEYCGRLLRDHAERSGLAAETAYFDHAALAIGLAALLDGVDGYIARLTNTASDFGRELDSLADVITFGVAPSLLAYIWGFRMLPRTVHPDLRENVVHAGVFVCFVFLICGASRLARFNISNDPQPRNPGKPGSKFFVGMPIPAGAGVIAAVVHCFDGSPIYNPWIALVWLALILFCRVPDGEQLAILERQRDYVRRTAAVSSGRVAWPARRFDRVEVGTDADGHRPGVPGFGRIRTAGLLVGPPAATSPRARTAADVVAVLRLS